MEVVQLEEGCTDKPISQATLIPFTSNFLRYQGMVLAFPNAVQSSGSVPISPPYGDNRVFQYPNVSPPISRQPLHLQPRMQCLSMQITSVILTTPQASSLDQYCRRCRTFKLFHAILQHFRHIAPPKRPIIAILLPPCSPRQYLSNKPSLEPARSLVTKLCVVSIAPPPHPTVCSSYLPLLDMFAPYTSSPFVHHLLYALFSDSPL